MNNSRDDFSLSTKRLLGSRVGMRCSNPACRKATCGANTDPEKITNIGVAAHICAAAEGGPRYDPSMSSTDRKSSENGIWLCQSCAKLIDSDEANYTKELLQSWKKLAEARSVIELQMPSGMDISQSIPETTENFQNRWFSARTASEKTSVYWGYSGIDECCKLSPGTIVLVAGRSNSGKSIYAQSIIRRNIRNDINAIYFNLKESSDTIANMMIAAESLVNIETLRLGAITAEDWERIVMAASILKDSKIMLEPYATNRVMSQYLLAAVRYGNADILVVDDFGGLGIADNEQLTSFMYQLRHAALESGTIVFILMDIANKPSREDKRPTVTDPELQCISRFCDIVQFLYKDEIDEYYDTDLSSKVELIIAKNYASTQSKVVRMNKVSRYATIAEYDSDEGTSQDVSEKYPGLLVGAKLLAECLKNL